MKVSIPKSIREINNIIIDELPTSNNLGLFEGKMGVCIYFYHLERVYKDKSHLKIAENLLDEIYEYISKNVMPTDFGNGLAGIAWGINYLIQNGFVEGDANEILKEIDDKIFQYYTSAQELSLNVTNGIIGYGFYAVSRLKDDLKHRPDSNSAYIFKRWLVEIINNLSLVLRKNDKNGLGKMFCIAWDIPLCLFLISEVRKMSFYNNKVDKIIEEFAEVILELFPKMQGNRLLLLLGLENVLQHYNHKKWQEHARILRQSIQIDDMLENEFKNRDLNILYGLTGISIVIDNVNRVNSGIYLELNRTKLLERITTSELWADLKEDKDDKENLIGVLSGVTGIGLGLLLLTSKE